MANLALKSLARANLGTSPATLFTSPAGTTTLVTRAVFTNASATATTLTVFVVSSGGTAGTGNTIISARSLAGNEAYVAPELTNITLGPGDFLAAQAGAATVNAFINGYSG